MHNVNLYRLQINDFSLLILKYLSENEKLLKEINDNRASISIKFRYNKILSDIEGCIKHVDYDVSHVLKIRFAEKINELNYENLCDICCEIVKHTKQKMPENIHKRIIFGKMNCSSREYARLTL